MMMWSEYIIMAAQHSSGSATHWFRYLRKIVDKEISKEEIDDLYGNKLLTPFQRVSLKYAFLDGSPTREHILGLNKKANRNKISLVREKYENKSSKQ